MSELDKNCLGQEDGKFTDAGGVAEGGPQGPTVAEPPASRAPDGAPPSAQSRYDAIPPDWQPEAPPEGGSYSQEDEDADLEAEFNLPALSGPRGRRRLAKPVPKIKKGSQLTPAQRLVVLDTWRRSGLPAGDFADMVGISKFTLYGWKKRFEAEGPAGLMDKARGKQGGRLPDVTRRTILMIKEDHPDWGCQRIADMLLRGPGLSASPTTIASVLHDEGYELVEEPTERHPDKVRRFERARPNQMWQSDLFTFTLKRQNRRVHLVAFMDDNSRFIVSYGLHASQSAALVIEVLRAGIASHGVPEEVLTDNGAQYVTWRGTSAFAKELQARGVKHIISSPRRPQTLGKVERFWGTLWRECLQTAIFVDLADAQARIGHFIDYYNFRRPHQGLDGLVPADRFFHLAREVKDTLAKRVAANALDLARNGLPKSQFYMTGNAGGKSFSVHAEGERVILSRDGQARQEVDLIPPSAPPESMPAPVCPHGLVSSEEELTEQPPAPGVSPLDDGMRQIQESLAGEGDEL